MWPFVGMSLPTATLIGSIANWALLACLLGGVVATFFIVQTTDVKEEHWAEDRRHSTERIVQAEKDIAEANARAAEAKLELEKYKRPRNLDIDSFLKILKPVPPATVEVLYVRKCSDCSWTAQFIGSFLNTAGWAATWAPIDEKKAAAGPWRFQPVAVSVKGYPWGITIVAKDITPETLRAPKGASIRALFDALLASYKPSVTMAYDDSLPDDLIRVVVAPKP
jgi:hypothetical protein